MKWFKLHRFCILTVYVLAAGCSTKEPLVELAEKTLPKTVMIKVNVTIDEPKINSENDTAVFISSTNWIIQGAGVFITKDGYILSCAHLFWAGKVNSVTIVQFNGDIQRAELISFDTNKDLSLLKVNAMRKIPYARIADPRTLAVGQSVLAIGCPLGFDFSVSHGIISALNIDLLNFYNSTQSDVFLNPGNSGGPLFNMKGELIGINSRIVPPIPLPVFTGVGFSAQSGQIIEFLTECRKLHKALPKFNKKYLGIL